MRAKLYMYKLRAAAWVSLACVGQGMVGHAGWHGSHADRSTHRRWQCRQMHCQLSPRVPAHSTCHTSDHVLALVHACMQLCWAHMQTCNANM
eukprot:330594-Chlamydomonas_euryale.AAC.14